jgi:hypothetical protein
MSRRSRTIACAALSLLWCGVAASAETLRCQSVNGNLNCVGSGGVSCQTVNGKTVCASGRGDVVQSFGGNPSFDRLDADPGEMLPPQPHHPKSGSWAGKPHERPGLDAPAWPPTDDE